MEFCGLWCKIKREIYAIWNTAYVHIFLSPLNEVVLTFRGSVLNLELLGEPQMNFRILWKFFFFFFKVKIMKPISVS